MRFLAVAASLNHSKNHSKSHADSRRRSVRLTPFQWTVYVLASVFSHGLFVFLLYSLPQGGGGSRKAGSQSIEVFEVSAFEEGLFAQLAPTAGETRGGEGESGAKGEASGGTPSPGQKPPGQKSPDSRSPDSRSPDSNSAIAPTPKPAPATPPAIDPPASRNSDTRTTSDPTPTNTPETSSAEAERETFSETGAEAGAEKSDERRPGQGVRNPFQNLDLENKPRPTATETPANAPAEERPNESDAADQQPNASSPESESNSSPNPASPPEATGSTPDLAGTPSETTSEAQPTAEQANAEQANAEQASAEQASPGQGSSDQASAEQTEPAESTGTDPSNTTGLNQPLPQPGVGGTVSSNNAGAEETGTEETGAGSSGPSVSLEGFGYQFLEAETRVEYRGGDVPEVFAELPEGVQLGDSDCPAIASDAQFAASLNQPMQFVLVINAQGQVEQVIPDNANPAVSPAYSAALDCELRAAQFLPAQQANRPVSGLAVVRASVNGRIVN